MGKENQKILNQSFMKELEREIELKLCHLGKVTNPEDAVKSIENLIYRHNPPHENISTIEALGKAKAYTDILLKLKEFNKKNHEEQEA